MHICVVTSAHPRYDVRIFHKEILSLAKKYEVTLLVADGKADEIYAHHELCNEINILSVRHPKGRINRMLFVPKNILRKIASISPDIVHIHDPELLLIAKEIVHMGYKVVYDAHEDLPKQIMNKKWIPSIMRGHCAKIADNYEKKVSANINGIIAATPIIKNKFLKYNLNTVDILNYPVIDLISSGYNSYDSYMSRRYDLCYVGSISEARGIIPLIESLSIYGLTLQLAGPFSDSSIARKVKKMTNFKNLVHYHGVIPHSQAQELVSQSRVGMLTLFPIASYKESLPIKLFEYMLYNLPCVASDFPMWRDIIGKHECGLLVNPKSPQEIAAAAIRLVNNTKLSYEMGYNGYNAVLNEYNWAKQEAKLFEFYEQLFKNS
jgi:glycosyltransferase involved in cell wall biosynthesis